MAEFHVALRIAYDGSAFDSYARQPGRRTVESELLSALRKHGYVEDTFRTGSRTDAGVSALENVCKAMIERPHLRGLVPAIQRRLPEGLWVTGAAEVHAAWRPRHARRRTYRYEAVARGEDVARVRAACDAFVGRHDMHAFAKMEEGRNPERSIFAFTVEPAPMAWEFRVEGDGFLWNQVRRMVSATLAVGSGDANVSDIKASLASGKPHKAFGLAPAAGLLLERVEYPEITWTPATGRFGSKDLPRLLQQARGRVRLAEHLVDQAALSTIESSKDVSSGP